MYKVINYDTGARNLCDVYGHVGNPFRQIELDNYNHIIKVHLGMNGLTITKLFKNLEEIFPCTDFLIIDRSHLTVATIGVVIRVYTRSGSERSIMTNVLRAEYNSNDQCASIQFKTEEQLLLYKTVLNYVQEYEPNDSDISMHEISKDY